MLAAYATLVLSFVAAVEIVFADARNYQTGD